MKLSAAVVSVLLHCSCFVYCYRRLAPSGEVYPTNASSISPPDDVVELDFSSIRRRLGDVSSESHLVDSLPGLSDNIKQYAGHITIDAAKSSNIFYWLFEPEQNAESFPLLIWLNGGPGCSSMDGLWLELGPLRLDPSGTTVSINRASWHNAANILFVDQPVGTGFAYTKSKAGYATNDDMINSQFYAFLAQFLALHPRYVSTDADGKVHSRPFFMSGESHAGHYIPTMAKYILDRNEEVKAGRGDLVVDLQGIALGNPWIDPFHQYDASDFAHGLGIINQGQKHRLKELEKKCQGTLKSGKLNNPACFSLLDKIVDSTAVGGTDRVLMYDARKYVRQTSSFPPGHEALERYLNRVDVKQAIHAMGTPNKFEECSNPPFYALSHQDGKGVTKELVSVLDRDLRVLVFAGQYDLICNHMGIEKVLRSLAWKHQRDWLLAPPAVWHVNGKPAGFVRAHKNLEYLIVLDAGHMVPMDQPKVGLALIQTFLQDRRFGKAQSKLGVALAAPQEDGASSLTQCPRFLEAAPNSTALHMTTQSSGDSLLNKLSLWAGGAGGGGKRKIGNLRKSRGPQMPGGKSDGRRVHAVSRSGPAENRMLASAVTTESEKPLPAGRANYCPFTTATAGSCCASVGWSVRSSSAGSWVSADRLDIERTRNLAVAVLQADFDDAAHGVLAPSGSLPAFSTSSSQSSPLLPVEGAARVIVLLGQPRRSPEDTVAFERIEQMDVIDSQAAVLVTTEVCGPAADVQVLITALLAQAEDHTSPLLSGLLTRHLDPRPNAIISHNRPQPGRSVE